MIKYHYLCGGILSILIAGTTLPLSASATDAPIPVVTADARPSVSQLEAAIAALKSTGSYQAYFIDQTLAFDASTPYYSEYNYLKKLVHDLEIFVAYYDELPTALLQDALRASKDAASGCTLIFNGQAKLDAAKKSTQTQSKPETTSKAHVISTTPTASNKSTTQKSTASSVATTSKSNKQAAPQSTASQPTPAPAVVSTTETPKPDESKQATDSPAEPVESTPVAVPATGEVENRSEKSPLPLFAAIIAGAAAASIIIAAILHRQPKSRSRRF